MQKCGSGSGGGLTRRSFAQALAIPLTALRSAAAAAPPKLTVVVVVEQLRPDALEAQRGSLGEGGLRRLMEGGAYYPDCRHLASTFPASTIATLATGAWPSQHGIVADSWYDPGIRRAVRASDEALLATTIAGETAASPKRRVFVVGMDGVSARLFAGTPQASLYWLDERGQFASRGAMPDWLAAYNRQKPIENLHDAHWMALMARAGAPPLRILTYNAAHAEDFLSLYRASPFAQMAQFEFLAELVLREQLGQGSTSDFACVLLGSTARLGYETGAYSPLMEQMILQLDRHVEFLLETLRRATGEGGFNLVLMGAHGAPPAPLPDARPRMAVSGEALAQGIQKSLGTNGPKLEKYLYPFLYLEGSGGRDYAEPVRLAVGRAALAQPAVAGYYTAGGACTVAGEWSVRYRNSFHLHRSGDMMLSYRPDYVEEFGAGRGVSYGSLYNYDACVPLCFYGPQFRAGTIARTVESVDVAPTLARVLCVSTPSSAVGRVLTEALAENVESKK